MTKQPGGARIPHDRRRPWPSLLGAIAVVGCSVVIAGAGAALGQGVGTASPSPAAATPARTPVTSRDGVEVPIEAVTPRVQCLLDGGFYIDEVHEVPVPGATPFFVYGFTMDSEAAMAVAHACREKYAPYRPPTEEEIREVYARWVDERGCLIRLGYQPQEPPSVETFIQTYHTGPWMPIDGTDYTHWSDEEYRTAKVECGLEMYDR